MLFNRNIIMSNLNGRDGPKGLKNLQKGSIMEEAEALTIHGWPRVISAKSNISRLAWSALCLMATGFLAYFTVKSLLKHSKHEVVVNINRKELSVMKFPAITFCNTNLYSITAYQNTPPPVYQEFPTNCSMDQAGYFANEVNRKFFKLGCKMFFGNKKLFTSQLAVGQSYKFKFPTYFWLLPHAYPCFTFDGSWLKQSIISSKAGLYFVLDMDENDRSMDAETASSDSVLEDERSGIYVTIHDPGDFHVDTGIPLSPGFETRISIQKSIIKRKKSPFPSKCLDDNEQQFLNVFPGKPSLDSCYSSCYFLNLYRKCHVVPAYMKVFMPEEVFPIQFSNTSCTEKDLEALSFVENCKCRLPCSKVQYVPNIMQSVWPQAWQAEQFQELLMGDSDVNRSISISDIRKRLIKVVVYYSDLAEYSYEERELYDVETILSDFGGQMGLFIGASVISLAEIASILWFYIMKAIKGKQRVRNTDEA